MATLDVEMLDFLREELGDEVVNAHLHSESRAIFAENARTAIKDGPATTLHEHVSRTLFGNGKRLDAAVWIANLNDTEAQSFWASQYSDWCRINKRHWPGDIGGELRRFAVLGMVQEVAHENIASGRTKFYRRLPSPLWDVFIMCDVVISEVVGERKYYQPSAVRMQKMVNDLLEIRAQTGGTIQTVVQDPEVAELARRRKMVDAAARARRRPRGPNGELRCTRCKEWKDPEFFTRRDRSTWQYKSWCKACMATRAKQRYMGLQKVEALNMVGLTFKVGEQDDVVGLSCAGCGEVILVGDSVHADAKLVHERCMT